MGLGSQTAQMPILNRPLLRCMTSVKLPELFDLAGLTDSNRVNESVAQVELLRGQSGIGLRAPSTVPAKQ